MSDYDFYYSGSYSGTGTARGSYSAEDVRRDDNRLLYKGYKNAKKESDSIANSQRKRVYNDYSSHGEVSAVSFKKPVYWGTAESDINTKYPGFKSYNKSCNRDLYEIYNSSASHTEKGKQYDVVLNQLQTDTSSYANVAIAQNERDRKAPKYARGY